MGPNVAEPVATKTPDSQGPRPVLHVAFIGRRARFPTAVPALMLFYFRNDVKDLLMISVTNQAKEETSKLIFWEIHPFTCCLTGYFVKALYVMFVIMRRVLKQLKHLHSFVLIEIR